MKEKINKIVVVNIGNELLSGRTVNTNLAFLGNRLTSHGLEIIEVCIIPDKKEAIVDVLGRVWVDSDLVIITGGLGPTQDDITRASVADFFGKELVYHEEIFDLIKKRFQVRNMEVPETNKVQAYVPEGFEVLENSLGTAPGLYYEELEIRNEKLEIKIPPAPLYKGGSDGGVEKCGSRGKYLFCLPGVPFEMEHLFDRHVSKFLKERMLTCEYFCKDINTYGVSESKLAEMMGDIKCEAGVNIAWLPKIGRVDIRISGGNVNGCERLFSLVYEMLKDKVWGIDEGSPVDLLHKRLVGLCDEDDSDSTTPYPLQLGGELKGLTISVAESCTGGLLASMLTKNSGASQYFKGGVVVYSNESKVDLLGVDAETITKYGAVSEEVARDMLMGCFERFQSDIVCSVTGVAGPEGGSESKPVGTVFVGVKVFDEVFVERCVFTGNRDVVRVKSCEYLVMRLFHTKSTKVNHKGHKEV